jgi:hypothetical protein
MSNRAEKMFNRQQIMNEAWAIYRRETRTSRPTRLVDRKKLFARCLRSAWANAKHRIAEAAKDMTTRAAERVQELTLELMRIDARPWKMRVSADRQSVLAEIEALRGSVQ